MLLLVAALVLSADPKPIGARECAALAEHGFALYLANLPNDEGIQYEMRNMNADQRKAHLSEVTQLLKQDKAQYLAEARTQCLERARSGKGTRKQYDCAMAATAFPQIEKCLGLKLGGEALR